MYTKWEQSQCVKILKEFETKDFSPFRWSIMTYELKLPPKASLLPEPPEESEEFYVSL